MGLIKGTQIILVTKTDTGAVDGFNAPIYVEAEETVDNVLIQPMSDEEILSSVELHGRKAKYTLHIPKGDDHNWNAQKVKFYGKTYLTIGDSLTFIPENTPGDWDKQVKVETYYGKDKGEAQS